MARERPSSGVAGTDSGFALATPGGSPEPIEAPQAGISVLGDKANLLLVREAFRSTSRYQDFKDRLGISDAVLANRLRDLVTLGVFHCVPYSEHPPRAEYRLTETGIDLWPTLIGVWMWEEHWSTRAFGRPPVLTHRVCGEQTAAAFGCGTCGHSAVTGRDLSIDGRNALGDLGVAPLHRYRRSVWTPSPAIDLYSEIEALLGDRWSLATIAAALAGVRRFGAYRRLLAISPPLLAKRLADLVARDVLERVPDPDGGAHPVYRPRPKGVELLPILLCNFAWANRWYPQPAGGVPSITHRRCGRRFDPAWFCASCRGPLDRWNMSFDIHPPSRPPRGAG